MVLLICVLPIEKTQSQKTLKKTQGLNSYQGMDAARILSFFFIRVSAVQQSESAICIHISPYPLPLEPPSHPPYPTPLGRHKA